MVTISSIAQRILDKTGYTASNCSLTHLEYLIDDAIDHINLVAGTSIADLSGTAESKSITATENELAAVYRLSELLLRARQDKGPQVTGGGISLMEVASDPHYKIQMKLFNQSLNYLRGRSFTRT